MVTFGCEIWVPGINGQRPCCSENTRHKAIKYVGSDHPRFPSLRMRTPSLPPAMTMDRYADEQDNVDPPPTLVSADCPNDVPPAGSEASPEGQRSPQLHALVRSATVNVGQLERPAPNGSPRQSQTHPAGAISKGKRQMRFLRLFGSGGSSSAAEAPEAGPLAPAVPCGLSSPVSSSSTATVVSSPLSEPDLFLPLSMPPPNGSCHHMEDVGCPGDGTCSGSSSGSVSGSVTASVGLSAHDSGTSLTERPSSDDTYCSALMSSVDSSFFGSRSGCSQTLHPGGQPAGPSKRDSGTLMSLSTLSLGPAATATPRAAACDEDTDGCERRRSVFRELMRLGSSRSSSGAAALHHTSRRPPSPGYLDLDGLCEPERPRMCAAASAQNVAQAREATKPLDIKRILSLSGSSDKTHRQTTPEPTPSPPPAAPEPASATLPRCAPPMIQFDCPTSLLSKYGVCSKGEKGVIGRGATACVKVVHCLQDAHMRKVYAVKEFRKISKNESRRHYVKRLASEFCISSSLQHPNIVRTVDLVVDENKRWCEVMEYCSGGDLYSVIQRGAMATEDIDCVFKQLITGVAYLHSVGVAHRDLKPENLLFNADGLLKITDFGVSEVFRTAFEMETHMSRGLCGSEPYIAPEEFLKKEYDAQEVDMWACGIVYYAMTYAGVPWQQASASDPNYSYYCRRRPQRRFAPFNHLAPGCNALMYALLEPDPSRRIRVEDVLTDAWFSGIEVCCDSAYASLNSGGSARAAGPQPRPSHTHVCQVRCSTEA